MLSGWKRGVMAVCVTLVTVTAQAAEYRQVQTNESGVGFGYTQMGVPMQGHFGKFDARLDFDTSRPERAKAKIVIDIASIDTGSEEANAEVVGKAWFDTAEHPTATFISSSLKALGGNRYEARGKLAIKGRTRDVIVPVAFKANGSKGSFEGVLNIKRLDFAIGEGLWSDVGTVADEIQIHFHFVVTAALNKK
jgi:polyisoprenoid-binding protein YceI